MIRKIISFIYKLFSRTISDEEWEALDKVYCPNCGTYICREDLISDNWICPLCHKPVPQENE